MNGLYDAKMDGAPVVVITGTTYHDLQDMRFIQAVDTKTLMQGVALFNVEVTGPAYALVVADRACRVRSASAAYRTWPAARTCRATSLLTTSRPWRTLA